MRLLVSVLLTAVTFSAPALSAQKGLEITRQGDTLTLTGPVRKGDGTSFEQTVRGQEISRVIVDSTGGDVVEAIKIANFIYDRKWPVTVQNICASSCANYWLAASPKVTVAPNSVIVMHGNIRHALAGESLMVRLLAGGMVKQEDAFFKRIGMSADLSYQSGEFAVANAAYWLPTAKELNCYGYHIQQYTLPPNLPSEGKTTQQATVKPKLKCKS